MTKPYDSRCSKPSATDAKAMNSDVPWQIADIDFVNGNICRWCSLAIDLQAGDVALEAGLIQARQQIDQNSL